MNTIAKIKQNNDIHSLWLVRDYDSNKRMELESIFQQDVTDNLDNEDIKEDLVDSGFDVDYFEFDVDTSEFNSIEIIIT